jgi:hypothetical protein
MVRVAVVEFAGLKFDDKKLPDNKHGLWRETRAGRIPPRPDASKEKKGRNSTGEKS